MVTILPLALAAAVYPTLLAGVIAILTRPEPKPLLIRFLAGGWVMSLTSGLVIVFVLDGVVSTSARRSASPTVYAIAGILSLVLAAALWRRRGDERPMRSRAHPAERTRDGLDGAHRSSRSGSGSRTSQALTHGTPKAAFMIGMVLNLPGLWYLVALNDIAAADYSSAVVVLLILIFNAIMFLLAEVPLIGYLVRPEQTRIRVNRFQTWLSDNRRLVAATAAVIVGLYLISRAVSSTV